MPVSGVEGCLVNISWQPSTPLSGTNLPTQLWHPSKHQELMGDHQKVVSMVLKGDLSFKTITILLNIINRVCKSVIVFIQWIPLSVVCQRRYSNTSIIRDNDSNFAQILNLTHTPSSFCHFLSDPKIYIFFRIVLLLKINT